MSPLTLTPATEHDLDLVMTLERLAFAPGNREERGVYTQRIRAFPAGSLLAHRDGTCIGCIFSEIWRPAPRPRAEHFRLGHDIRERHAPITGRQLYISSMTINPACRGQGLGAQLFGAALSRLADAFPHLDSAILLVNESWGQARRIYTAAGFREIARFPDFFNPAAGQYEDGIVMRRSLQGGQRPSP